MPIAGDPFFFLAMFQIFGRPSQVGGVLFYVSPWWGRSGDYFHPVGCLGRCGYLFAHFPFVGLSDHVAICVHPGKKM